MPWTRRHLRGNTFTAEYQHNKLTNTYLYLKNLILTLLDIRLPFGNSLKANWQKFSTLRIYPLSFSTNNVIFGQRLITWLMKSRSGLLLRYGTFYYSTEYLDSLLWWNIIICPINLALLVFKISGKLIVSSTP